jgi:hypothetical protein
MDNIEERQVEKWKDIGNVEEKLNSEKMWTIWKKVKLNSQKIWKLCKNSRIVKQNGKYGRNVS